MPVSAPAGSGMDGLFGSFWPERDVAGQPRAVIAAAAVGVLAGIVLPFRGLGVGTFLVLLACGAAVLATAVHRRSPFTLGCSGLCVLLAATFYATRSGSWCSACSPAPRCSSWAWWREHGARLRRSPESPGR